LVGGNVLEAEQDGVGVAAEGADKGANRSNAKPLEALLIERRESRALVDREEFARRRELANDPAS
jgi:hypothetical protein